MTDHQPGTSPESEAERLQQACDGGEMRGCYDLGIMYEDGDGVPQDSRRAAELYQQACNGGYEAFNCESIIEAERLEQACDGGNMEGCYNLGWMYRAGFSVRQSDTRAAELYQQACDGGEMEGCFFLGLMYLNGDGVRQSDTRAAELYQQACDGGHIEACNRSMLGPPVLF
jgi:hypothetical protein